MAKKNNKVIMVRNSIIGFVSVIVILILGFGTYVSTGLSEPADVAAGEDYREVASPKPRRPGDPIEVVEFFSYSCVHCKNFEPVVTSWAEKQADDVRFRRQPAMWSPVQTLLGRTYVTFETAGVLEDNHMRVFRAIHDARRQFLTPEMVADYVDGRGMTRDEFLREFNSPAVRDGVRDAERDQRTFEIRATPSLVVAGRYVVNMNGGQGRALEVVDHLIEKIRAEEASAG